MLKTRKIEYIQCIFIQMIFLSFDKDRQVSIIKA